MKLAENFSKTDLRAAIASFAGVLAVTATFNASIPAQDPSADQNHANRIRPEGYETASLAEQLDEMARNSRVAREQKLNDAGRLLEKISRHKSQKTPAGISVIYGPLHTRDF